MSAIAAPMKSAKLSVADRVAAARIKYPAFAPTYMEVEEPLRFWSNAKLNTKLHMLSNLYEAPCAIMVNGVERIFPSAEHAYQALQKIDDDLEPWTLGGAFSDWEYVYSKIGKTLKPNDKWKKKKQIGILAILVIRRPDVFGLTLKAVNDELAGSYEQRWKPIFQAKYASGSEPRSVLMSTRRPLLEFRRGAQASILKAFEKYVKTMSSEDANRQAHRVERWGGLNNGTEIWGQNVTGKNLTRFRDESRDDYGGERAPKRVKYKQFIQ